MATKPAKNSKKKSNKPLKTDWDRVDAFTDEDIEEMVKADPDVAPLADKEWFKKAKLVPPRQKFAPPKKS
jgi:hypothetical protein